VSPRRLLEDADDLALARSVALPPRTDRRATKAPRNRVEHGLHLARETGEDEDVLEDEPRRASERVGERLGALRQTGPAGRVIAEPTPREALPQGICHGRHLLAGDTEGVRHAFARDVVGRAAETARDEDHVRARPLRPQEGSNFLDVVTHGCHQLHLDAETGKAARKPGGVRVLDVPRDYLVADRENDRRARGFPHAAEYRQVLAGNVLLAMAEGEGGISSYEQLRRVQAVSDAALAHLSLDALLNELLIRIRDALEADTCAVLLLDEERNELVARAAKGIEEAVERGVRIPVGKGFAGRVAAERRPVVLGDVDHADVLNPILRERGIKSLLGVPLLARDRVLGVLHVGTLTPREFTSGDVQLLELVAERTALALERAILHEELLMLDRIKREFLFTAAHELRTPASVIHGVAQTLSKRFEELDPPALRELVDAFYNSSERLARLTDQLLDFSRLEERASDLTMTPVALRKAIEEVLSGLSARSEQEIDVEIPEEMVVLAESTALERIVGNLVRNALVHGAPPVSIRAAIGGGAARISVADQGPGIPQAFVGRLFDPFSRSGESLNKPGAGLGLAIAQSYARRLGGDLLYQQARPRGAMFTLVLPQPNSQATSA
jgi:signal transduction histidine kinase